VTQSNDGEPSNAAIAAISAAGLAAGEFLFLGFLPKAAKARRELLAAVARLPVALVVYEAPHRVRDTVAHLGAALAGERVLVVAREVTKKFESITRTTLAEAPAWFDADPNHERGEFVLLVDAPPEHQAVPGESALDLRRLLVALVAELPPARAARVAAAVTGLPRDAIYAQALALKSERG